MFTTCDSRFGYWFAGFAIIWAALPATLLDILAAPQWHAPNWKCDSLGIPVMRTMYALPFWTIIAAVVPALLIFLFVRRRLPGASIFAIRLGQPLWNLILSLFVLLLVIPLVLDFVWHFWQVLVPQTIMSDCRGRAEVMTVTMRKPVFQIVPLIEFALCVWILHVRTLLLSPRV